MGGIVAAIKKPIATVVSLLGGDSGYGGVKSAMQSVEPAAPQAAPPTVADTKTANKAESAVMGVSEVTKRRRRASSRVSTLLSDLNDQGLGG